MLCGDLNGKEIQKRGDVDKGEKGPVNQVPPSLPPRAGRCGLALTVLSGVGN